MESTAIQLTHLDRAFDFDRHDIISARDMCTGRQENILRQKGLEGLFIPTRRDPLEGFRAARRRDDRYTAQSGHLASALPGLRWASYGLMQQIDVLSDHLVSAGDLSRQNLRGQAQ